MSDTIQPGLYQHFKGNLYRVLNVAQHSETEEQMVVYQAMVGDKGMWVRPLSMFDERIEREGKSIRRFARCDEQTLSLEVAILNVKAGQCNEFELAFAEAKNIIAGAKGYLAHELRRCEEQSTRYIFTVHWQSTEHHEAGFRGSDAYQKWRSLLHHFYDPLPTVEHYHLPLK